MTKHNCEFDWMLEDTPVCHVKIDNGFVTTQKLKDVHWLFMPFGRVPDVCVTKYVIEEFFRRRCFDEHCAAASDYLRELGLEKFNAFQIVQKTKGRMYSDEMWVRFCDDTPHVTGTDKNMV